MRSWKVETPYQGLELPASEGALPCRLQNGRFDSADRLFINLRDSYQSATSNPADVKELTPEFFLTDPR